MSRTRVVRLFVVLLILGGAFTAWATASASPAPEPAPAVPCTPPPVIAAGGNQFAFTTYTC